MEKLLVNVPAMYGDHHVVAVRNLMLAQPGVEEVYASSGFQVVELTYDPARIDQETILAQLEGAGYLGELEIPVESGKTMVHENGDDAFYRHSTAHANTGSVVSFAQQVPTAGRVLWPCPGMGTLESVKEALENG